MKILSVILGLLLISAPLLAEVFTPADWDRVDAIIMLMTRDRYQHGELIVKKSFRRVSYTSVDTEHTFCWIFDANVRKSFMSNSKDGLYWVSVDAENYLKQQAEKDKLEMERIMRSQLRSVETIVALVNLKDNPQ